MIGLGKIFCSQCGTELDDSAKFCSNCGNVIEDDSPKITNNSYDNRKILIMGGIAILVILLLVGGIFIAQNSGGNTFEINGLQFNVPNAFDKYESSSQTIYGMYSETYEFSSSGGYNYDSITITVTDIGDNDVSDLENKMRNDWVWDEQEIGGKDGFGKLSGSTQYGFVYYQNNKQVIIEVPMVSDKTGMGYEELISYVVK